MSQKSLSFILTATILSVISIITVFLFVSSSRTGLTSPEVPILSSSTPSGSESLYFMCIKQNSSPEWGEVWTQLWECSSVLTVPPSLVHKFSSAQEAADKIIENIRAYVFWADLAVDAQFRWKVLDDGSLRVSDLLYYVNHNDLKAEVDAALVSALESIPSEGRSPRDLSFAIDEFLCSSVRYGDSDPQEGQTIYSALVRGEAVCAGFSRAFNTIALLSGLNSRMTTGYLYTTPASEPVRHAWNVITADGVDYYTDTTTNLTSPSKTIINALESELAGFGLTPPERYAELVGAQN